MPFRSRLRSRLIRLLGGRPPSQDPPPGREERALAWAHTQAFTVLPEVDPSRQALLADQYYAYAEELIRRGAADLSAPFYRQAYVLLKANRIEASATETTRTSDQSECRSLVIDLGLEPETSHQSAAANTQSPGLDAEARIRSLQMQLNAETLESVDQQAKRMREEGLEHPDLDHLQGVIHLLRGEHAAAQQCFRNVLAKAPEHYRSLVNLAGLLLPLGRLEEAEALLHKALAQVDSDTEAAVPALTNLSLVHQAAGRQMDEALLVLNVQRLKPGHVHHERLLNAATVLEAMAEDTAAIELLQWLADHGAGEKAWRPLAALLERRGDYQAAALIYRQLLQPMPKAP